MVAPAVDLGLPTDQALLAAAAPNPEAEAARVTRGGDPGQIHGVGEKLGKAGADLDQLYEHSLSAQRALADSFTNDGAPVYDEQAHRTRLPAGFRDAGTRLYDVSRRLGVVADELESAIAAANESLRRLRTDLDAQRSRFAAEVDTARSAGGLIPVDAVARLQARRAAVAGAMHEAVSACGRAVRARVGRYNEVVGGCLPMLGELGRTVGVDPERVGRAPDTGGTRLNPVLEGRLAGTSAPAPSGPTVDINPIPAPRPREPGFTPTPPGPGPLITLPAPDLGTGVQDGPGSGQRVDTPGMRIDADAPAGHPAEPRIHDGQQGKHIPGHPNFVPEKSPLTVDPGTLLGQVGTGEQVGGVPRGEPGFRERVEFGRTIGEYRDEDGNSEPTSIGIVHYRKDGSVHIVPGKPR